MSIYIFFEQIGPGRLGGSRHVTCCYCYSVAVFMGVVIFKAW